MTLPVNTPMWIISALPIVTLLVLMIKFKWGAVKSAPIGLLVALISGYLFFKAPITLIFFESVKGLWNAITVLIVIFPAILIYEVTYEAKAFTALRTGMQKISRNELLQILAIGLVFVSFLQGITGFGVPVAVGAPILVGMGLKPIWAVSITLLGHAWANTFGTLGVAWEALIMQTNLHNSPLYAMTAFWAASFLWIFNFIAGIIICWWYGGKIAVRKGFIAILLISIIQGGGQLLLTQFNPTLAAFFPTSIALCAILLLGKFPSYTQNWYIQDSPVMNRENIDYSGDDTTKMNLPQAFFPYLCLILITCIVLLINPINDYLGQIQLGFPFPETKTAYGYLNKKVLIYSPISPFTHAGILLFVSALFGFFFFHFLNFLKLSSFKIILWRAGRKTAPSALGIISLLIMSKIMLGTGQILILAEGTASLTKLYYAPLAPFIGILGAFITSSNLASNIIFGNFQQTTATILNLNQALILGAQTAGGAMGNTISPGNVLLGTTTTGILGGEGIIIKKLMPITIGIATITGVIFLLNLAFQF
jgi:lactate permease